MRASDNRRWMLVDDDCDALAVLAEVFMSMGEDVVCFSSPIAAIHAFRANPTAFELVVSDFDMPQLDGVEMCHVLRSLAPELKTILATGNTEMTEREAEKQDFDALLPKPFTLSALADAIEKVRRTAAVSVATPLLQAA